MLRAVLISYLAIATAVGPSLCCCASTAAVSNIRGWFGLEPIHCANCSRFDAKVCTHRHTQDQAAHHCAGHRHAVPGSEPGSKSTEPACTQHEDKPTGEHSCPCRQEGNRPPALPASIVVGKAPLSPDVLPHVGGLCLAKLSLDVPTIEKEQLLHEFRSQRQSGREILRALHILRC